MKKEKLFIYDTFDRGNTNETRVWLETKENKSDI